MPCCDTQMLGGYREIPVGGGGIGVAGASVGSSWSVTSMFAAAAAEFDALVDLAALAVRQHRIAQQQPSRKPKRKINIMTMIVNFTVL